MLNIKTNNLILLGRSNETTAVVEIRTHVDKEMFTPASLFCSNPVWLIGVVLPQDIRIKVGIYSDLYGGGG
jgi:hypothetical protein